MKQTGIITSVVITYAIILTVLLLGGRALAPTALTAGEQERISEVCLDCHEDHADNMIGTPHQILSDDMDDPTALIACTDCHPGDKGHWDDDPEEYPITDPRDERASVTAAICSNCHVNSHQQNMMEGNPHSSSDVNCTGCHQLHEPQAVSGLLKDNQFDLCLDCHGDVRAQFAQPYRHPAADGVMACSDCHMRLAESTYPLSYAGTTVACATCHNEFQGPFPFEHQATVDYSTEEGSCLNCHDPHGSNLPRMLRQPYESPSFQLCGQCHVVPKHNFNLQHGTQFAGESCGACHADIHGSYTSRLYFTPALQAQGCINVGCHQL